MWAASSNPRAKSSTVTHDWSLTLEEEAPSNSISPHQDVHHFLHNCPPQAEGPAVRQMWHQQGQWWSRVVVL